MLRLESGFVSEADLTALATDGAIVVRKVFDVNWVERIRRASQAAVERQLAEQEAAGTPRPARPAFHNVLYMHRHDPEFRAIALDSPAPRLARDLMQTDKVILFADHLLVKEPGAQIRTPWHQDLPYWPVRGRQITSLWIALDPVTRESGALEYVRGSHLWGKMYQPQNFDGISIVQHRSCGAWSHGLLRRTPRLGPSTTCRADCMRLHARPLSRQIFGVSISKPRFRSWSQSSVTGARART